jgi:hypothetical protein
MPIKTKCQFAGSWVQPGGISQGQKSRYEALKLFAVVLHLELLNLVTLGIHGKRFWEK